MKLCGGTMARGTMAGGTMAGGTMARMMSFRFRIRHRSIKTQIHSTGPGPLGRGPTGPGPLGRGPTGPKSQQINFFSSQISTQTAKPDVRVFRNLLFPKLSDRINLDKLTKEARPDIVILSFENAEDEVGEQLHMCTVPIYIRTGNLEHIGKLIKDYHHKIHGFVTAVNSLLEIEMFLAKIEKMEAACHLAKGYFKLIPIIDSRSDSANWADIASSSTRNVALIFEDNSCDNHDLKPTSTNSRVPIQTEAILAARAVEIPIILGPDLLTSQTSGYQKRNYHIKQLGFSGRIVLNATQSIICKDVFSISKAESETLRMIRAAQNSGIGTIQRSEQESRRMVGPPHRLMADLMEEKMKNEAEVAPVLGKGKRIKLHPEYSPKFELGKLVHTGISIDLNVISQIWMQSFREDLPLTMSDEVARQYGFKGRLASFSLMAHLPIALSVMRFTAGGRFHLGTRNAVQYRPVYRDDRIHNAYKIWRIHHTSEGYPIVDSRHYLNSDDGEVLFAVDKTTMFKRETMMQDGEIEMNTKNTTNPLLNQIKEIRHRRRHVQLMDHSQLYPGQMIAHKYFKQFNRTESKGLSNAVRATNAHHINVCRFLDEDIVVPGFGAPTAALANSHLDLGHVIYETWPTVQNVNIVNQDDVIRSLTYVRAVKSVIENPDLEEIHLKTFGFKNISFETLKSMHLSERVVKENLRPSDIEQELQKTCPDLAYHMVVIICRNVIRLKSPQP